MGVFLDGEWESICKLFTVDDSPADLTANFLEYFSPTTEQDHNLNYAPPLSFSHECNYILPHIDKNSYSSLHNFLETTTHTHSHSCSDDLAISSDILSCIDFSMIHDGSLSPLFLRDTETNTTTFNNNNNNNNNKSVNMTLPNTELNLKRKRQAPVLEDDEEERKRLVETPMKNARVSYTSAKKRKTQQKCAEDITPTVNTKENDDIPDSNSDDSNNLEEINETEDSTSNISVSTTSTGKKRACRGAATDPQSLYARLLSSDDFWMYAPLAYNGLDVGAYGNMPPFLGM
ncbi:hypothetical protein SOVF_059650 [Spinacia oleracea]|nr:hypothetical protein SOVF_059650 [Spinacia oleracea]